MDRHYGHEHILDLSSKRNHSDHADVVKAATSLQPMLAKMEHATTLSALIFAGLCFARCLAVMLVENELARRAALPNAMATMPELWCSNSEQRISAPQGFDTAGEDPLEVASGPLSHRGVPA
jgi:hypothetical protein